MAPPNNTPKPVAKPTSPSTSPSGDYKRKGNLFSTFDKKPNPADKSLAPRPEGMPTPPKSDQGPKPEELPPPAVMRHDGNASFIPRVESSGIQEPDTPVDVAYCLEHFARVMIELAEQQKDPLWVQSHLTLAQEWHQAAATLLQHAVDMESTRGEVELKQQQMVHNDMDHQQNMSHQETLNKQTLQHNDDQHKQNMAHQEIMKKNDLQHSQTMNKQAQQFGDQKSKMQLQQGKEAHQNKMQFTKSTQQARMQQIKQKSSQSAAKKPTPK